MSISAEEIRALVLEDGDGDGDTETNVFSSATNVELNSTHCNKRRSQSDGDEPTTETERPLSFAEYQEMRIRTGMSLDHFGEDGVPSSPDAYKLWVRYYRSMEKRAVEAGKKFSTFEFRPSPSGDGGRIYYDNGQAPAVPVSEGTWVIDKNDEVVSGPYLTTRNVNPQPEHLLIPPGRNRYISEDEQAEDSGIADCDEELPPSPNSPSEFRPPLNSTPNQTLSWSKGVAVFLPKLYPQLNPAGVVRGRRSRGSELDRANL